MTHEQLQELKQLTIRLREYNSEGKEQYLNHTVKEGFTADFYTDVKPFADRVFHVAKQWKPLATTWVEQHRPKYVYLMQITNAYEQLLETSVAAFQTDTKTRRFIDTTKSIDYILETILHQIECNDE